MSTPPCSIQSSWPATPSSFPACRNRARLRTRLLGAIEKVIASCARARRLPGPLSPRVHRRRRKWLRGGLAKDQLRTVATRPQLVRCQLTAQLTGQRDDAAGRVALGVSIGLSLSSQARSASDHRQRPGAQAPPLAPRAVGRLGAACSWRCDLRTPLGRQGAVPGRLSARLSATALTAETPALAGASRIPLRGFEPRFPP
jgi:hypothetical protein